MANKAHALAFLGKTDEAKELHTKAINLSQKVEVLKDLASDIGEFEKYKLPKEKISILRRIYCPYLSRQLSPFSSLIQKKPH